MASANDSATSATAKEKYFFLIRRLHSLSGLVPVGVFVVIHLVANSRILTSGPAFQETVNQIHLLDKMGLLIPVEVAFIFLPLLFHAVLGVVIVMTSTPNSTVYRYGSNTRYTLQRATGMIAFVFIMVHLWQMHWLGKPFGGGFFDPHDAASTAASAMQTTWLWSALYAVGVVATVFHLANGIWTSLITWGITIGPHSQRIAGYACTAFGLAVGLIGLGAVYGFHTFEAADQPEPKHAAVAGYAESGDGQGAGDGESFHDPSGH